MLRTILKQKYFQPDNFKYGLNILKKPNITHPKLNIFYKQKSYPPLSRPNNILKDKSKSKSEI